MNGLYPSLFNMKLVGDGNFICLKCNYEFSGELMFTETEFYERLHMNLHNAPKPKCSYIPLDNRLAFRI